jgi:hypothetical protein
MTLHGYTATDERPGINVYHASAARHLRLFYELCTYNESGSPLEGLISPRPAHSRLRGGTSLGGTPTGTRISWRHGRVTGSRTRINGLPFLLTVFSPSAPAAGGPAEDRASGVLAASRPARGRRARPGRLPRLRGSCRAAARLPSAGPLGAGRCGEAAGLRRRGRFPAAGPRRRGAGAAARRPPGSRRRGGRGARRG